jgi:hypothetical protein
VSGVSGHHRRHPTHPTRSAVVHASWTLIAFGGGTARMRRSPCTECMEVERMIGKDHDVPPVKAENLQLSDSFYD